MHKANKLTTLIVYYCLKTGGVEKKIIKILNHIDRKKFKIHLALLHKKGKLLSRVPQDVKVYDLKKTGIFGLYCAVMNLRQLIEKTKPAVILTYGDLPSAVSLGAKFLSSKKPRVIIGVGNVMSKWIKYQRYKFLRKIEIKTLYPSADQIIAVSKAVKKDLIKNFSIPRKKIEVIYNFVDNGFLSTMNSRQIQKNTNTRTILFAGRLVKQKRVYLIIKAFPYIKKKLSDVELVIIGEGPEKEKLISLSQRLGVDKNINFRNFTLKIEKEIASATIVVLPSAIEGHPNLILESMMAGTPVVVSNYPGASELIKDKINGYLVPLNISPQELANKITDIISDKERLLSVSENAQRFVEKLSVKNQIRKYELVLNNQ